MRSMKFPPGPGYSGTPLAKKLGMADSFEVLAVEAPPEYRQWLEPLPPGVTFVKKAGKSTDLVHLFLTERTDLAKHLSRLRGALNPHVPVWVSWPKKASKVPTSITEDVIREIALPLGYVDVKVCAVSDVWSGLKLVVRKELRAASKAWPLRHRSARQQARLASTVGSGDDRPGRGVLP